MIITQALADRIATSVNVQYSKLPKKGKPTVKQDNPEWTVLAGIVMITYANDNTSTDKQFDLNCVALG
jgi:hypothetical protein